MFTLTLLAATLTVTVVGLAILCIVATNDPTLIPATVNPFGGISHFSDPSAVTMPSSHSHESTMLGDWQTVELNRLSEVEDLLDSLENSSVRHREFQVLNNNTFVVRWRN